MNIFYLEEHISTGWRLMMTNSWGRNSCLDNSRTKTILIADKYLRKIAVITQVEQMRE